MNLFNQKDIPDFLQKLEAKEAYSYTFDETSGIYRVKIPNGEILYAEHFFDQKISDRSLDYFLENENGLDWRTTEWRDYEKEKLAQIKFKNIKWTHDQIRMFGKIIYVPRYSSWHGDAYTNYTYSGLKMQPKPWNKGLNFIKQKVNEIAGLNFNSVLLNWYRDGIDSMGWHADDEKELGQNPVIASVNFGATRRFLVRRKDNHKEKIEIALKHGTLLIMSGEMQHYWQHSVPKEKKVGEDRLNLTFRVIVGL